MPEEKGMLVQEYATEVQNLIETLAREEGPNIEKAAARFHQAILEDRIIHVFGTGHSHMIGIEMFVRAGGLANVNAMLDDSITTAAGARRGSKTEKLDGLAKIIWDNYTISSGDIMIIISNSGRNSVPVEMAQLAKENGIYLIAITSLAHSMQCASRHASGQKLYQLADLVLDNHVPAGDSLLSVGGKKTAPGSTIAGSFLVDSIVLATLERLAAEGQALPIFSSQNVDGFNNDDLYRRFEGRIRHM